LSASVLPADVMSRSRTYDLLRPVVWQSEEYGVIHQLGTGPRFIKRISISVEDCVRSIYALVTSDVWTWSSFFVGSRDQGRTADGASVRPPVANSQCARARSSTALKSSSKR